MIIDTCEIIDFISGGKVNKPTLFYVIKYVNIPDIICF